MLEYAAFFVMAFGLLSLKALLAPRRRYDIVEAYNLPDFLVFTGAVQRLLGAKLVLYLFEAMPEMFIERFDLKPDGLRVKLLRFIERLSVGFAHRVIVEGPWERELRGERGLNTAKIEFVTNVPEDELFRPREVASPAEDGLHLISHGSVLKRYGLQTLVRAVPPLKEKLGKVHVWIVGDGEYRVELESLAAALGVTEDVTFTGMVPHEDVAGYIGRCQIGVCPMLYSQLPNKLFEYIAMEKPVVCAEVPSIRAVFDEETMLFYAPDDHEGLARRVIELWSDPDKGKRLAENAKRVFAQYSWARMRDVYVGVHDELLPPSGPSRKTAPAEAAEAGEESVR
jgi:glycosyltransferase involved in cell wall biosynthesis